MAFDGVTIAAMVDELHKFLDGGRFNKIAQPEADELLITGKGALGPPQLFQVPAVGYLRSGHCRYVYAAAYRN